MTHFARYASNLQQNRCTEIIGNVLTWLSHGVFNVQVGMSITGQN
jgi:hypothetical protein